MSYDPFNQTWTVQDDKIFSGPHVIAEVSGPRWREIAAVMAAGKDLLNAADTALDAADEAGDTPTPAEWAAYQNLRLAILKAKGGIQ